MEEAVLESAKKSNEIGYLRALLAQHSHSLDERLYYLCKTYTANHRVLMKRRKGELTKSKHSQLTGTCEECISIGDGSVLLTGGELPQISPILLADPTCPDRQIHATFLPCRFKKKHLWVNILDTDEHLPPGRWNQVSWGEAEDISVQSARDNAIKFFEQPFHSTPSKLFFFFQIFLIVISVGALCVETLPRFNPALHPEYDIIFFVIELVVTIVFTIETLTRIALQRRRLRFLRKPTVIADIIAVLPFYLDEVFTAENITGPSILKLCRLFRMMKFFRNFRPIENLVRALEKSAQALLAPFVFLTACSLVVSSAMYYCEKGSYDAFLDAFMVEDPTCPPEMRINNLTNCAKIESKFSSIPVTIWWSIVTMTTVGYGDMVPLTPLGKFVGGISMILGIMFMAMPIAIVGSYFTVVVDVNSEGRHDAANTTPFASRGLLHKSIGGLGAPSLTPAGGSAVLSSPKKGDQLVQLTLPPATRDPKKEVEEILNQAQTKRKLSDAFKTPLSPLQQEQLAGERACFQTKAEKLSLFLQQVIPENGAWCLPGFLHHVDVWMDTNMDAKDTTQTSVDASEKDVKNRTRSNSSAAPSFGCLELGVRANKLGATGGSFQESPVQASSLIWLTRPMVFSIGSRCAILPDPDIVIGQDEGDEVSQRHAEITVSRWWSAAALVKVRALHPHKVYVNGCEVTKSGCVLKNSDTVAFGSVGQTCYTYRTDRYSEAIDLTQQGSTLLRKPRDNHTPPLGSRLERSTSGGAAVPILPALLSPVSNSESLHLVSANPLRLREGAVQSWVSQVSATSLDAADGGAAAQSTSLHSRSQLQLDAGGPMTVHVSDVDSGEENLGALGSPFLPKSAHSYSARSRKSMLDSSAPKPRSPLSGGGYKGLL